MGTLSWKQVVSVRKVAQVKHLCVCVCVFKCVYVCVCVRAVTPTSKQARTLWAALTRLQTGTLQGSTQQGSGEAAQPVRMVSAGLSDHTICCTVCVWYDTCLHGQGQQEH